MTGFDPNIVVGGVMVIVGLAGIGPLAAWFALRGK